MRQYTQGGFIFFLTLMLLSITGLLLLTSMAQLLLYYQAINKLEQKSHDFYALEQVALQLTFVALDSNPCVLPSHSANKIITILGKNKQCLLTQNNIRYDYLLEDLGIFPCLITEKKKASQHIRLTVSTDNGNGGMAVVQMRVIRAVPAMVCSKAKRPVKQGVSSWRYLADIQRNNK